MDSAIRNLLQQILSTPGFRAWLESDPVAALASVGITLDVDDVPNPICLPSDADIQALLAGDPNIPPLSTCMIIQSVISWQSH